MNYQFKAFRPFCSCVENGALIMKTALLASSATFDGIKAIVEQFYHSEKELISVAPDEWKIIGKMGVLKYARVILKKGRYRFESINN